MKVMKNYCTFVGTRSGKRYQSTVFSSEAATDEEVLAEFLKKSGVHVTGLFFACADNTCSVFVPTECVDYVEIKTFR